jgi:hypothetical protein
MLLYRNIEERNIHSVATGVPLRSKKMPKPCWKKQIVSLCAQVVWLKNQSIKLWQLIFEVMNCIFVDARIALLFFGKIPNII